MEANWIMLWALLYSQWLLFRKPIYSFDIETEKVNPLPAPPGLETPWSVEFPESWVKDRIVRPDIICDICIPIITWKDGEILMQNDRDPKQLVSYNPKEKKFRKVGVYGCDAAATTYIPSFHSLKTVLGGRYDSSSAATLGPMEVSIVQVHISQFTCIE
ncbi:hypothetical protein HAX54_005639 [Datura stramonium]|uniref:Uncharacterized protein n=1 Tax=Datura stramonium TaxID=4076 RepID=A0ABS8T951_DATST|nr:hypothetical protein [Datura stramonium]